MSMDRYISEKELENIKRNWLIDELIPANSLLLFNSESNFNALDDNMKRQLVLELLLEISIKYKSDNIHKIIYITGNKIYELFEIINRWKIINNIEEEITNISFLYKDNLILEEVNYIIQSNIKDDKNYIFIFDHVIINSENINALCSVKKPMYYINEHKLNSANIWILDLIENRQCYKYFDIVYDFIDKQSHYKILPNTIDVENKRIKFDSDELISLRNY